MFSLSIHLLIDIQAASTSYKQDLHLAMLPLVRKYTHAPPMQSGSQTADSYILLGDNQKISSQRYRPVFENPVLWGYEASLVASGHPLTPQVKYPACSPLTLPRLLSLCNNGDQALASSFVLFLMLTSCRGKGVSCYHQVMICCLNLLSATQKLLRLDCAINHHP